jgi:putative transposase
MGGIDKWRFRQFKSLLQLPDEALELADRHNVDEFRLRFVLHLPQESQAEMAQQIIRFKLTGRQVQEMCGKGVDGETSDGSDTLSPQVRRFVKSMRALNDTNEEEFVQGLLAEEKNTTIARARLESAEDERLLNQIRAGYQAGRGLYGSSRIHAGLREQGILCSRKPIARLMRQADIHSPRRPKRRVPTTDRRHSRPVAANLLQQDFNAQQPNEKWLGDIVGIWTEEGWLYLAALLDSYSRRIVGWAMSAFRDEALVSEALRMALTRRNLPDPAGLIHHTDRGSQYTAEVYLVLLKERGNQVSMSGTGNPYDNAMTESFFSTLRAELTDLERFPTRQRARTAVFEFIEVFYNRQRLHSSLGYLSPADFEAAH